MRRRKPARRRKIVTAFGLVILAAAAVYAWYAYDMWRIRTNIAADSQVVDTRHGAIEFASWGSGPAVLVVHGAGGGYDQGRMIPDAFGGDGYRWISVSRFGYLRSSMPADASTRAQAEAFVDLLDVIGVDRVGVIAMSGGVPPALQFGEHFPDRTQALVLLSGAPFTPLEAPEAERAIPTWVYQTLFRSDFVFWAINKVYPKGFDRLFDVSTQARERADPTDLMLIDGLIDAFLPVTDRIEGLRNEVAAIDPAARYDLAKIEAPTLIVHALDDGINPVGISRYMAEHIRKCEFVQIERGGHLLLGNTESVRARVTSFLSAHLGKAD